MKSKIKRKVQPSTMLPSDTQLLASRPALLDNFGLTAERGVKAKAIDEFRTATQLDQDIQSSPGRDELKVNMALAHITNAVILAVGTLEGRMWLETICAQRGQSRKARTPLLLHAFKRFGPYDRSEEKRRQSSKYASDDARAMLNALALEKKLPMELATKVFTTPGKGRSSFYRAKGESNSRRNCSIIKASPIHDNRIRNRPIGAKALTLSIRTEDGAEPIGLILDPRKIAAIVAYAKKLNARSDEPV